MSATVTSPVTPTEDERRKRAWRPLAAAAAAGSVLVITGFGVWASLNATATGVSTVDSGTLTLALADKGVGFSQAVSKLAPGDKVSRFVTLTNTGTLEGKSLTMGIESTGATTLIDDAAETAALRVTVQNCASAWVAGACAAPSTLLNSVELGDLGTADPLAGVASLAKDGGNLNLKVTVALPMQDELSVNGALPTDTVQGKSVSLKYTFAEVQRTETDTFDATA